MLLKYTCCLNIHWLLVLSVPDAPTVDLRMLRRREAELRLGNGNKAKSSFLAVSYVLSAMIVESDTFLGKEE